MKSPTAVLLLTSSLLAFPGFNLASAQVQQAWVARYHGPAGPQDSAAALAVDAQGNVYVTGSSAGAYSTIKYDADGNRLWLARYENGGSALAVALALDASDNVLVTGIAGTVKYSSTGQQLWVASNIAGVAVAVDSSGAVFVTGPSVPSGTNADFVTAKYDRDGQQLWQARYNGPASGEDVPVALHLDAGGNVYVCGRSAQVETDYALVKYNGSGQELWVAHYVSVVGGLINPGVMTVDLAGEVYVTGIPPGAPCVDASSEFATLKFDSNGNILWLARYGSLQALGDIATAIAVDVSGNTYVAGRGPTGYEGLSDFVLVKYDPSGRPLWSSRYHSGFPTAFTLDTGRKVSLALDTQGNAYVTGAGGSGYATIKFDNAGNRLWIVFHPGLTTGDIDSPNAIAVDGVGNIYVTGQSDHHSYWGDGEFATVKYLQTPIADAPRITSPPLSQIVTQGANITLSVTATGDAPLSYQWFRRGEPMPGATSDSVQLSSAYASDHGSYWVEVRNQHGVVASPEARLIVQVPPSIWYPPQTQRVLPGATVRLDARAEGRNLSYQWRRNGIDLPGATNCSLVLTNVQVGQSGGYTLVVTNALGTVISALATLSVGIPAILTQPKGQSVVAGSDVTLTVTANGPGSFSYQWYFKAAPLTGAASASLTLHSVGTNDSGVYHVVITNSYGAITSAVAMLTVSPADPVLDHWEKRYPPDGGGVLYAVGYGNGLFVAVGGSGAYPNVRTLAATSTDGVTWTPRSLGTLSVPRSITYGDGTFVAVGSVYTGSNYLASILSSTDGVSWTEQRVGTNALLSGVTHDNGLFVAVGYTWPYNNSLPAVLTTVTAIILTSQDGVTWTQRNYRASKRLFAVTHGDGSFVAVGDTIVTSTDGVTWLDRGSNGLSNPGFGKGAIAYGNGLFVAVNGNALLTSSNGIDWLTQPSEFSTIAFGNGVFVATRMETDCHEDDCYSNWFVATSTNALHWSGTTPTGSPYINAVGFGGDLFVLVGSLADIFTSPVGYRWIERSPIPDNFLNAITYGNGSFVAVGRESTILTSTDGSNWVHRNPGDFNNLQGVTYGSGKFVAVGTSSGFGPGNARILTSVDAVHWNGQTAQTNARLRAVAYGNGTYVAVGDSGTAYSTNSKGILLRSTDGSSWISSPAFGPDLLNGITYGNGIFVVASWSYTNGNYVATIFSSVDGLSWFRRSLGVSDVPLAVAYGNNIFVAMGFGAIWTSADAVTWRTKSGTPRTIRGIAFGNGYFVAVGWDGTVLTSSDGITWARRPSGISDELAGVAYGNGSFVAVGGETDPYSAVIVQSGFAEFLPEIIEPTSPLILTAAPGETVTLSAALRGAMPIFAQWQWINFDGGNASVVAQHFVNSETEFLALNNIGSKQAGIYTLALTNFVGGSLSTVRTNAVLTVLSDQDGDGLPDDWELTQRLDPGDASDANLDSDGDTLSNRQEYLTGTDPRDAKSYLKIQSIEFAKETAVRLTFLAVSNRTYTVQWRASLADQPWSPLTEIVAAATNRLMQIIDPDLTSQRSYGLVTPRRTQAQ